MAAVYVRVPWRGCITIPGLLRRVSTSSRDGHNSATWTPVPGTTRRPRARDTLMLFYKHCRPMGPLLQTQAISAISVELSVATEDQEEVLEEKWKSPEVPCLYLPQTLEPVIVDTLSAPGHSWLATGHHRDSQLSSVCVESLCSPPLIVPSFVRNLQRTVMSVPALPVLTGIFK